jgi:hypothetical protein
MLRLFGNGYLAISIVHKDQHGRHLSSNQGLHHHSANNSLPKRLGGLTLKPVTSTQKWAIGLHIGCSV